MRIYISGAITGTTDYLERFADAERRIMEEGKHSVVNPARVNACLPEDTTYEQYMDMSFTMLDMCDAIYMLPGWENSRGANREYGYALGKGIIILEEKGGLHGRFNQPEGGAL